ncbi:hypothetical protein LSTR_LSTR010299 [Laodelphax striatellus]|uniref:Uncharacterized protein n=1 Tax=Laodelphax striatellus TaxID=195883 RepID=A0A482XR99_LAOST|nr:hypothetical protein LSTR_LSTR010299 [Laodelphax striatellus]
MHPNLSLLSLYVIQVLTISHVSPDATSSVTVDSLNDIYKSVLQRSVHAKLGERVERLLSVVRFPKKLMRKLNDSSFETSKEENSAISLGNSSQWSVDHGHGIEFEGRKMKGKKYHYLMIRMLMGLKIFIIGLVLPAVIGMAFFASWKGLTISLLALLTASIFGMKNFIETATKHEGSHHILITSIPSVASQQHQHWWRKSENPEITSWDNSHDLVYRGHR